MKRNRAIWSAMLVGVLTLSACGGQGASAENYPEDKIEIIVPWGAGGSSDVLIRAFAEPLQKELGESVLVVNRPGGGSAIGAAEAARAKPDGYTLLHSSSSTFVTVPMRQNVKYGPEDFQSVISLGDQPIVLVASKDSGYKSLEDVAKKADGTQKIAVTSQGNVLHLIASNFIDEIGLDSKALPFDASSDTTLAVANGDADFAGVEANIALPQIESGEVVPLAVTSNDRLSALPDVPTFEEEGFESSQGRMSRVAISVPADAPEEVVKSLNDAGQKALESKTWKDYAKSTALVEPEYTGTEFLEKFVPDEKDWTKKSFPAAGLEAKE